MIPISIDIEGIAEELQMDWRYIEGLKNWTLTGVANSFADEWYKVASKNLNKSKAKYLDAISVLGYGVSLLGWLPNAIENGAPAFDMKKGLLYGPKAKMTDKGVRYNTIPFQFSTPNTIGGGSQFTGGQLPKEVHEAVKAKPVNIPTKGGMRSEGLKKSELPTGFSKTKLHAIPFSMASKLGSVYKHKAPLHEGISKFVDKGVSSFRSFRRVSENSDPSAWIHPGFIAMNLAEKALDNFDAEGIVGQLVDSYLNKIGLS